MSMYILSQNIDHNTSGAFPKQGFGVVDDLGNVVDASRQYRSAKDLSNDCVMKERFLQTTKWESLKGNYFYGGVLYAHFGHFLTE